MIAAWMLYATLVSGLLYGAALVLERAPAALGWSRRWVWAGTIAASVTLPLAVALRRGPFAATSRVLPPEAADAVRRTLDPIVAAGPDAPAWVGIVDGLLIGSWIVAALGLFVMLVRGQRALGRSRASWRAPGPEELGIERDGLEALTAGAPVRLTDDQGPAVAGALRTEILLPRWCLALPPADRALVLAHEGEHVRGGDPRLLFAARAIAITFPWLLPLWWQLHRLRLAVEIDCDTRVLRRGFEPPRYGRLLLEVGSRRSTHRDHSRAIAALATPSSQLERRIRAMFDSTPRARWVRATTAVVIAAGLVVVACESPTPFESEAKDAASSRFTEMPVSKVLLREHNQRLDASQREIEGSLEALKRNEFTLREMKADEEGSVATLYWGERIVPGLGQSGEPVELEFTQRKLEQAAQAGQRATGGVLRKMAPTDAAKAEFHFERKP